MFRKHERTSVQRSLMLVDQRIGEFEVVTQDVSSSGFFVNAPMGSDELLLQTFHIGDELQACLETPDDLPDALPVRVARVAREGLGLTFA